MDNEFQSLMVLGKNKFLYISVLVVITLICLLCPDLDGLVLNTMSDSPHGRFAPGCLAPWIVSLNTM